VFLALFMTVAITLTLMALREPSNARRMRWCMVGAGVALGLGLTVKWSAGFLLLAVLLAFLWMQGREPARPGHGMRILATVLAIGVLPVGVYLATYSPWIVNFDKTYIHIVRCKNNNECSESLTERIRLFLRDQDRIREFQQSSLQENNSNADASWKWVNQSHPSTLFRKTCRTEFSQAPDNLDDQACAGAADGDIAEVVAVANPIVWFTAMGAGLILLWRVVFRRDRIAFFLLAFALYQWIPWALNPRHSYTFYESPLIPALALWLAAAFSRKPWKWLAPVFVVLTVAAFAFYYPIWSAKPMSPDQIRAREYWLAY
jgi:4-amino-4-deoxy-L-arabinose transferase-like glycosyltransferase